MQTLLTSLVQVRHSDAESRLRGQLTIVIALTLIALTVPALGMLPLLPAGTRTSMAGLLVAAMVLHSIVITIARRGWINLAGGLLMLVLIPLNLVQIDVFKNATAASFLLISSIIIASLIFKPRFIWLILALDLLGILVGILLVPDSFHASQDLTALVFLITELSTTAILSWIGALVLRRALRDTARARDEVASSTSALRASNHALEHQIQQRTAELQMALLDAEERMADQAAILAQLDEQQEVIGQLSLPVLPISARVLVMPLVGVLDQERIGLLRRGLVAVQETRARWLLLDVTGLSVVDEVVANGLLTLMRAVRLLGADVLLVGVRPELAQTLVSMSMGLDDLHTQSTLQDGIAYVQRLEAA